MRDLTVHYAARRGGKTDDAQRYTHVLASHNAAERFLSYVFLRAGHMLVSGRISFQPTRVLLVLLAESESEWKSKTVTLRHACHSTLRDEHCI